MTEAMSSGSPRQFDIQSVHGLDWWIVKCAPRRIATRHIALKVIKVFGAPCPESPLFFIIPGWRRREVINAAGDTRVA